MLNTRRKLRILILIKNSSCFAKTYILETDCMSSVLEEKYRSEPPFLKQEKFHEHCESKQEAFDAVKKYMVIEADKYIC